VRVLAALLVSFGFAVSAASANAFDDRSRARALVIAESDVPLHWTATIVRNPCPSANLAGGRGAIRVATRWGGLNSGIWSVAFVAPTSQQARGLFQQITATLPNCTARYWRTHMLPPGAKPGATKIAFLPLRSFAGDYRRWRISILDRRPDADPVSFEVVVLRRGRAVAQYVYGRYQGLAAIRRALTRS
jgi:hypothetical protein